MSTSDIFHIFWQFRSIIWTLVAVIALSKIIRKAVKAYKKAK